MEQPTSTPNLVISFGTKKEEEDFLRLLKINPKA